MPPFAFLLVALSALVLGLYDVCRKHAVRDNSAVDVLLLSSAAGFAAFLAATVAGGGVSAVASAARIPATTGAMLAVKVGLVGTSWGVVFLALRRLPISLAAPVRATSPLWTLLGAVALYGEAPRPWQLVGMALMVAGNVALASIGTGDGWSWRGREMLLIVLGTVIGAASSLYDKHLLSRVGIPPSTVQLHFSAGLVMLYGAVWCVRRAIWPRVRRTPFAWRWTVPLTGVLLVFSDALYFRAVATPGADISMVSVFRRCSAVVAFVVGGLLFRDRHLRRKGGALFLVLLGAALAALG